MTRWEKQSVSELPEGWVACRLGDVIRVQNGYAFPSKDFREDGVPLIRQSNLAGDRISLAKCVYLEAKYLELKPEFILRKGDVLIGMSGSLGKLCVCDLDQPALQNQRTGKIIPRSIDLLSWRFIFEFLRTIEVQLLEKGKGLGVQNVSASDIESLPFRLPPSSEQHRIVAKLEQLLGKVDACQMRLAKVPVLLKRFRQSVLAAACSGRLTTDWRARNAAGKSGIHLLNGIKEQRLLGAQTAKEKKQILEAFGQQRFHSADVENVVDDIPETWVGCVVGQIGTVCNGSTPSRRRTEYWAGGIPWVSSGEVRNNSIRTTRETISDLGYENSSVRMLPTGAVLLAMIGEGKTRGQSAILEIEATINQNIAAVTLEHGLVSAEFLWRWFQLQYESTRERGGGSGPQALNCERVRELPFVLPPTLEQEEIVRRVEALFKLAELIETRYRKAQSEVDKLTQSILAKAFRGELVPTEAELARRVGRDYEPASVLLERIGKARSDSTAASATAKASRLQRRRLNRPEGRQK
jgi:type I restriction enzyme S subunit